MEIPQQEDFGFQAKMGVIRKQGFLNSKDTVEYMYFGQINSSARFLNPLCWS